MNLEDTLRSFEKEHKNRSRLPVSAAASDDISDTVTKVFSKKLGKTKGYAAIENSLRSTIESEIKSVTGGRIPLAAQPRIERYLNQRLDYMKNSFKTLNDPMKDKSDERADFIGDFEQRCAKWFGKTLGYDKGLRHRKIKKMWVVGGDNPCDDCQENEDEGPIDANDVFPSGAYSVADSHPSCECEMEFIEE